MNSIAKNINDIRKRIENTSNGKKVTLIAVTKTFSADYAKQAIDIGISDIAESKIQEAIPKFEALSNSLNGINKHFIGHLQSNKAKKAVLNFDLIQSLDSIDLAKDINRHAKDIGKVQKCLIELKVSTEATKSGASKEKVNEIYDYCVANCPNVLICGIMTIAPYFDDKELVLNKLSNYDDLFYHRHIQDIRNIRIVDADYLSDPVEYFDIKMVVKDEKHKYLSGGQIAAYLYNLKQKDPDAYAILLSAITVLIPTIESIEPIVISANNLKVDDDAPYEFPDQYELVVKEKFNNQQTRFQYLSTGSMKLLYLLTTIIRASREGVQLLLVEELENSIHPSLLRTLLDVIAMFLDDTKLLFTSHSPILVRHLSAPQLYVGLPSSKGEVDFRTIRPSKVNAVLQIAGAGEMAIGEYLFELLQDTESDPSLIDVYFTPKKA